MIRLRISAKDGVKVIEFKDDKITLGRSSDNTVKVEDKNISRNHAIIEKTDEGYRLRDLESRNGTFLNTNRIQSAVLAKGDVVRLGTSDVFVYVEEAPEPKPGTEVELKAVPVEDKLEVRRKIDDLKKVRTDRTSIASTLRSIKTLISAAAVALLLLAGVVGFIYLMAKEAESKVADRDNSKGSNPSPQAPASDRDVALASLKDIENSIGRDGSNKLNVPTLDQINKVLELQKQYSALFSSDSDNTTNRDPFQSLLREMYDSRNDYLAREFDKVRTEVQASLNAGQYSKAMSTLATFGAGGGQDYPDLIDLMRDVQLRAGLDYANVQAQIEMLNKYKKYEEVVRVCGLCSSRFDGTKYRADILRYLDVARQTLGIELAAVREKYGDVGLGPRESTTPNAEARPKPAPAAVSKYQTALSDAINSGKVKQLKSGGKTMNVSKADANGIKSDSGNVAWDAIGVDTIIRALSDVSKDLVDLAKFARSAGYDREADAVLYKFWKLDEKRNKPTVDDTLAAWRGLTSPPEGGFSWNTKLESWEDALEKSSNEALAKVMEVASQLSKATNAAGLESAFEKAFKMLSDPKVTSRAKEEIKKTLVQALTENKEAKIAEIKQKAQKPAGGLSTSAHTLETARKECLRVMYDTKIYLPEGHPNYQQGLQRYKASCEPLHGAWGAGGSGSIDGALRAAVQTLNKINELLSSKLGQSVPANDLDGPDMEEFVANASVNGGLNVKNYALTRRQREIYDYNGRVDSYNNGPYNSSKLSSTGAPSDTMAHLNILNAWREELGRRKLFMDARLQKAAQKHAGACAAAGKIWHVGSDGSPQSRCQAEGFDGPVGENVCLGYGSPQAAFKAWDEASDHCRNQCSDMWNCVGVGHVGRVWCQDFGKTTPPPEIAGR
jgi:pSer/pThr/pTyr-binding forkhead associated (FHA) protein